MNTASEVDSSTRINPSTTTQASWYRWPLGEVLQRFSQGRLTMEFPDGTSRDFGKGEGGPQAVIAVRKEDFFRRCVLFGGVGMGEAYMDGDWDSPDLRAVIEWFVVNVHHDQLCKGSADRMPLVGFLKLINRLGHLMRSNSRSLSRKNIAEHYDLGNDFYRLWLDESMTYSCARFTSVDQTLESAQAAKYEALCRKLDLRSTDHVLEIGCGWGGFSLHAASQHGCRVTAVTISQAQFDAATEKIRAAGLEDRVTILLQDYRDLTGTFDKIASIEMLEAVGDNFLETWCAQCHRLLKPDGILAVQMIIVPDGDFADLRRGTDFIQKHIFPGSLLLSVGRMNQAMMRTGDLTLLGLDDMASCYVRTLREWHKKFNARLDDVRALGFPESFLRKWNYYLKYCEAAFATRNISVVQASYTRRCNFNLHREDGISTLLS
jgi:cyclopropane-fatty-acyl-phospholipid synthase